MKKAALILGIIFTLTSINSQVVRLTDNSAEENQPYISGNNIVWYASDGNDNEIYLYLGDQDTIIQLTNNATNDASPRISGNNVVWVGNDGDAEIFFYDGNTITQVTNNAVDDWSPEIDGNNIVWRGSHGAAMDIFHYNGSITQITDNDESKHSPRLSGDTIAWVSDDEIYFYDGTVVTPLTANGFNKQYLEIDGNNIAWAEDTSMMMAYRLRLYDGNTTKTVVAGAGDFDMSNGNISYEINQEVFLYNGTTHKQLSFNSSNDYWTVISGNNVMWYNLDAGNYSTMIYIGDRNAVYQVDNSEHNYTDPFYGGVSGNNFCWLAEPSGSGTDKELYRYTLSNFTASFTASDTSWCDGSVTTNTLTNSTNTNGADLDYRWTYNPLVYNAIYQDSGKYVDLSSIMSNTSLIVTLEAMDGVVIDTSILELSNLGNPTISVDSLLGESCYNFCDGSITVSSNAALPKSYSWSNLDTDSVTTGLCPGDYTVSVTDGNGCEAIEGPLTIIGPTIELNAWVNMEQASCLRSDGTINIQAEDASGTPPYSYLWSIDSTEATVSGLGFGEYYYTVTDANDCIYEDTADLDLALPDTTQICLVTADWETGKNMVIWGKIEDNAVEKYLVHRETVASNVYEEIGEVMYDSLTVFIDLDSDPEIKSYKYKVSAIDSCGNESELSKYHKTMLLTSSVGQDRINLSWTEYVIDGEDFGFESYIIYRGSDPLNLDSLDIIASDNTLYPDLNPLPGDNYYRIEGIKPGQACDPANLLGKKANSGPFSRSLSNIEDNRQQSSGIQYPVSGIQLKIFPNPMSSFTTIEIPNDNIYQLSIFDLTGKIIRMENNISGTIHKLERANLETGMYIIELKGEKTYKSKLIVE